MPLAGSDYSQSGGTPIASGSVGADDLHEAMSECIYCRAPLTERTKRAHVWPSALGGRLRSRKICCDDCNNAMSPLERLLHEALRDSFASVGATNEDGEPISVRIKFEGREFVLADGYAVMDASGSRFDKESKSIVSPLPTGLGQQAEKISKIFLAQGLGTDDVSKLNLSPGDPGPELPVGPTLSEHDLKIGTVEHHRVFVKMALELLAYHRHDLAMRSELCEARRFVRHGEGVFRGKPDRRSPGSGLLPDSGLPEVLNAIEAWSCKATVFFRVVFLGPLVFTGTLCTNWAGEQFRAIYAFDACDSARRVASTFEAGDGPNLAIWIDEFRDDVSKNARDVLDAISLRLAQSKSPVEREASPDIEQLRDEVRAKLRAMNARKKRR